MSKPTEDPYSGHRASISLNDPNSTMLDEILGLPPIPPGPDDGGGDLGGFSVGQEVEDSMLILELVPCMPMFHASLQGYRLEQKFQDWLDDLSSLSIFYPGQGQTILVAAMSDNPPSEMFSNVYGDSFLANIVNATDLGVNREVSFMGGNMGQAGNEMAGQGAKALGGLTSVLGSAGNAIEGMARGAGNTMESITGLKTNMGATMESMVAGARVDFPQTWKGTDFSPSYTFNIRLYCEQPGLDEDYNKHIVGPLMALMLFVVPISKDGSSYTWPYLCKFRMRGLIQQYAGYIRSLSIIKGGDDNSISHLQRPGIIDLKMDVAMVYPMIMNYKGQNSPSNPDVPILKDYIKALRDSKKIDSKKWAPKWGSTKPADVQDKAVTNTTENPASQVDQSRDAISGASRVPTTQADTMSVLNSQSTDPAIVTSSIGEMSSQVDKYTGDVVLISDFATDGVGGAMEGINAAMASIGSFTGPPLEFANSMLGDVMGQVGGAMEELGAVGNLTSTISNIAGISDPMSNVLGQINNYGSITQGSLSSATGFLSAAQGATNIGQQAQNAQGALDALGSAANSASSMKNYSSQLFNMTRN